MKAIVEYTPQLENLRPAEIDTLCKQFIAILRRITVNGNELALSNRLEEFKTTVCFTNQTHHFHWGFEPDEVPQYFTQRGKRKKLPGNDYLWVKQRGNDARLIYSKLENRHT